jgi:hypothetical protein
VVVVVSEDGDHRGRERAARVGQDRRLLRQPVRRQVAGEKHEIAVLRDRRECPFEALSERLHGVDVARGRDTNRRLHRKRFLPAPDVPRTPKTGTPTRL